MPDIQMRFLKDVLVLSAPLDGALAQQGFQMPRDLPYVLTMEPESLADAVRTETLSGAQCLVAPTSMITAARLSHANMANDAPRIAAAAMGALRERRPQHVLAEIGPCGLPLDASSKASLNENRLQYAQAARVLAGLEPDALFLNGFTRIADLKCALMGVVQVCELPVFASMQVTGGILEGGRHNESVADALAAMVDLGAAVLGFETADPLDQVVPCASQAVAFGLPVLVQLHVRKRAPRQGGPTPENPYYCADAMEHAAVRLYGAGVQFLRATGAATPAYTGALVATTAGLDVRIAKGVL